jgi:hypothetical protein
MIYNHLTSRDLTDPTNPHLVIVRNGAVSAEQEDCSKIGVQSKLNLFKKKA